MKYKHSLPLLRILLEYATSAMHKAIRHLGIKCFEGFVIFVVLQLQSPTSGSPEDLGVAEHPSAHNQDENTLQLRMIPLICL